MELKTTGTIISLILTAVIGLYVVYKSNKEQKKDNLTKEQSRSRYYLAAGVLNKNKIFFTVFATIFSAFTVVGLPAMFYAHGWGTFLFMGIGIVLTTGTLHLIGRKITRLSIKKEYSFSSPLGLLTDGYGSKLLTLLISIITIVVLFPYLVLQIAGIGKFLVSISDGSITYLFGTIFCCIFVAIYMFNGGAEADARTDQIQGIILITGTVILGIILIFLMSSNYESNWTQLTDAGLLSLPGPKGYFTPEGLISFGIIFTLISISTPQVSQKLMGLKKEEDLNPLIKIYWLVGLIIIALAGLIGFYAYLNLNISSPDFVTGDVLRDLSNQFAGVGKYLFFFVGVLFITGILSAAISTIDSLIIAISGIISDNFSVNSNVLNPRLKWITIAFLILGLLLSSNPPLFIVDLAKIQLAGLTALVPCLLGPLFGVDNKLSGWLALILGISPIIINYFYPLSLWNLNIGVIGLALGLVGLLMGKIEILLPTMYKN